MNNLKSVLEKYSDKIPSLKHVTRSLELHEKVVAAKKKRKSKRVRRQDTAVSLGDKKELEHKLAKVHITTSSPIVREVTGRALKKTPEGEVSIGKETIRGGKKEIAKEIADIIKRKDVPSIEKMRAIKEYGKQFISLSSQEKQLEKTEKQIKELRSEGYRFKKTEEGWIPYKPLTKEEKRILAGYKEASKTPEWAMVQRTIGWMTIPGLATEVTRRILGTRYMKQLEKEVEKDYEKMKQPSFERLKDIYYRKSPFSFRAASSLGWSVAKTGLGIITFPEFVVEEGAGRLYTWVTKGKAEKVNIVPFSEEISKAIYRYTPPSLTLGIIEAGISSAISRSWKPFEKVKSHPFESAFATIGEIATLWIAGKVGKAISDYTKSIIKVQMKPVKTFRGWKFRKKYSFRKGVSLKELEEMKFVKFRYPEVTKVRDVYSVHVSEGMLTEIIHFTKKGTAVLKPGKKIGIAPKSWVKRHASPRGSGGMFYFKLPKEIRFPDTVLKAEYGVGGAAKYSSGVKGILFKRAYVGRIATYTFGKAGKPLGGIAFRDTIKAAEDVAKRSFSTIFKDVAFPVISISPSSLLLPSAAVVFMPRYRKRKLPATATFSIPEIKVPTIKPVIYTAGEMARHHKKKVKPSEAERWIQNIENIFEIRSSKEKSASSFMADIGRSQKDEYDEIQTDVTEQMDKMASAISSYSVSIPKLSISAFPEEKKKKKRKTPIENKNLLFRGGYREFYYPVRWLFR